MKNSLKSSADFDAQIQAIPKAEIRKAVAQVKAFLAELGVRFI